MAAIVRTGTWMYDGVVEKPVDIISLEYDWWYMLAEADGVLEPDEEPEPLSQDSCLYYVRFRNALQPVQPTWPDSCGYATVEEAVAYAESKTPSPIRWRAAT